MSLPRAISPLLVRTAAPRQYSSYDLRDPANHIDPTTGESLESLGLLPPAPVAPIDAAAVETFDTLYSRYGGKGLPGNYDPFESERQERAQDEHHARIPARRQLTLRPN